MALAPLPGATSQLSFDEQPRAPIDPPWRPDAAAIKASGQPLWPLPAAAQQLS